MTEPLTIADIMERERVSRGAVTKWIKRGVKVRGRSTRVKLEAYKAGGAVRIRPEALADFLRACNGETEPVRRETPRQASQRALDAQEALRQRLKGKRG